ncbi:MAG: hypothetical protein NTX45_24030 [Proteobacteria bacterium]|nr:hypothetical protein [Pseudomonadota bacterium]
MNTPNVNAGRLERRVRRVGGKTMLGIRGFCSFYSFGAIRGVPLLRLTAIFFFYVAPLRETFFLLFSQRDLALPLYEDFLPHATTQR